METGDEQGFTSRDGSWSYAPPHFFSHYFIVMLISGIS